MTRSGIHLLVIFLLFAALLSGGCAKFRPIWNDVTKFTGSEKQAASSLEQTRKRHSCSKHEIDLYVEKSELTPAQVSPGNKIKHVLRYALCAPAESAKVQGLLIRKITFKGKAVRVSNDSDVETFKAGTWTIHAAIKVPEDAQSGSYILESIIRYKNSTIKRNSIFIVRK